MEQYTIEDFKALNSDNQRKALNVIIREDSDHNAEERRRLGKPEREHLYNLFLTRLKCGTERELAKALTASDADDMLLGIYNGVIGGAVVATPKPPKSDSALSVPDSEKSQLELIREILGGAIDEGKVKKLIAEALKDFNPAVKTVTIKQPELPDIDMGVQHKQFEQALMSCNSFLSENERLNVWLNGEAGTGKTTCAKNIAKALNLPYYLTGAIDNEYKLNGFIDAQGRVISTEFRKAWEFGGVFLFDEVDASSPNAVLSFNGALANGVCPFPDKNVKRHKDCIIIAAGNSATGATANYNGRYKPDGAFFDRFAFIEWDIDEELETATASNKEWCKRVQALRKSAKQRKYPNFMVTPRATYQGQALLASGLDQDMVECMVIKRNLTEEQWQALKGGC